ncbi:pyridoxamine 5'-phosphate oxidase family protein [Brevibacillus marinus]|uniref:pyridoxamine 5'-phosphate oxidase family protein n=1 Tax=Brevibacillus marinus TaxID=2496837 RepID=UPI000F81BA07|nr:pyridoxamine 5'-phosphate oxidase family protein [Brevibacillus marinus]
MAQNKKLPVLEEVSKHFIAHSPFLCMATRQPDGRIMITGHGGQPGFVQVRDDRTLVIPYQADQHARDLLQNFVACADVGLIFLIPNVNETLRIDGKAQAVSDQTRKAWTSFFREWSRFWLLRCKGKAQ